MGGGEGATKVRKHVTLSAILSSSWAHCLLCAVVNQMSKFSGGLECGGCFSSVRDHQSAGEMLTVQRFVFECVQLYKTIPCPLTQIHNCLSCHWTRISWWCLDGGSNVSSFSFLSNYLDLEFPFMRAGCVSGILCGRSSLVSRHNLHSK